MRNALLFLIVIIGPCCAVQARERARHPDDVAVTTTLAQRLAARVVIGGAGATNIEEAHDLNALVDDLDFAGSVRFIEALGDKAKTFTLDGAPKLPQSMRLARSEAKTLVKWLVPGPKSPWDASFSRAIVSLVDDINDALAKPAPR